MSAATDITDATERLLAGEDIGRSGAEAALAAVLSGAVDPVQTGGFLIALRAKGETADEIAGLAAAIRSHATAVSSVLSNLVDTCGSGGGAPTFNISTAAAIVAAGAGAAVAKHGNRSVTSRSGSADVLESLGVRIDIPAERVGECLDTVGIAFMFAPNHHPAFRHVGPVRKALGVRTIFNVLGPLVNPAGASRQVIGLFDVAYLDRVGEALHMLGTTRALVVAGRDGIDEISITTPTDVVEVSVDGVHRHVIDAQEFGIARASIHDLRGGSPDENAVIIRDILGGVHGPPRDVVAVNAGAVLWIAGVSDDLGEGIRLAHESIDSGSAARVLSALAETTTGIGIVA